MRPNHTLLLVVRFLARTLFGILLLPLAPGHSSHVVASLPAAASLSDWPLLDAEPLAATAAWTRTLDPAIITGSQLPLFQGVSLGDLFVYAYDGSTWAEVPFQIDEVEASGTYTTTEDSVLDSNDELVFMASDLGVTAEPHEWLADLDSRGYSRYEVSVTNPLNTAEEGWVYVYRSATLAPTFSPYVTWDDTNSRLVAGTYIIGYDPESHIGMDSLELNGSQVDVLDRSKFRVSGSCYTEEEWQAFEVNEESEDLLAEFEPPDIQGPVRQGGGTLDDYSWYYASLFENTTQFDASFVDEQCEEVEYKTFRVSDDWRNPSESGMAPMTFYDSNTPGGVPVDGVYDSIPTTPVTDWWEVSGARGSLVQLATIDGQGATVTNYYWDVENLDPDDTGDQLSFGDAGYKLAYPDAVVTMSFANYVLGPHQGNVGNTYRQYYDNPLEVAAVAHGYLVAPTLANIDNADKDGDYLVEWGTVSGATGYELQEDDNPGFTSPTVRYSGSGNQYYVRGQSTGLWYYRVRARNAGGNSLWSNTESVTVIPPAPVLFPISNPDGNGNYLVDWSDVIGATGYELQEDDNPAFSSPTERYSGADSQYQVSGQAGGIWYYRVRASSPAGDGLWSNVEWAAVESDAPALASISNPDGDGDYLVDWTDVTGATSYELQVDDNSDFDSATVCYDEADSQFQVYGQGTGLWYYRVRAISAGGEGPWSNIQSVGVVPSTPDMDTISNPDEDGDYLLDWNNVTGATSYELQEDNNLDFTSPAVRYSGPNSQYQVYGQGTGRWYYRVRASSAGGDGAWSEPRSVGVAPSAPHLESINNPGWDGEYVVNWNDVTGAESYELEEADNAEFTSPTVPYVGADSQFLVIGQEGGKWHYRVRASNAGGTSDWSNIQSTGVVPAAPVLATIANSDGDGEYLVDWPDVISATSYRLEEDDNPDFTTPTIRYSGPNSQYQVSAQEEGLWYYRVRASNEYGNGSWSDTELAGVVTAPPVLSPIDNPNSSAYYLIDWSDAAGATSYELQEDENPDFESPVTVYTGSSTQLRVSEQPLGTWHYRVRAYNNVGHSLWSGTESVLVLLEWRLCMPVVLRGYAGGP